MPPMVPVDTGPRTPLPSSLRIFYANGDPNCQRMLEIVQRIPQLHPVTSVVDVQVTPYEGIDRVPAIYINNSVLLVGTEAFQFLRNFDMELDAAQATGSLGFMSFEAAYSDPKIQGNSADTIGDWFGPAT